MTVLSSEISRLLDDCFQSCNARALHRRSGFSRDSSSVARPSSKNGRAQRSQNRTQTRGDRFAVENVSSKVEKQNEHLVIGFSPRCAISAVTRVTVYLYSLLCPCRAIVSRAALCTYDDDFTDPFLTRRSRCLFDGGKTERSQTVEKTARLPRMGTRRQYGRYTRVDGCYARSSSAASYRRSEPIIAPRSSRYVAGENRCARERPAEPSTGIKRTKELSFF